jgi:hypothetical protein
MRSWKASLIYLPLFIFFNLVLWSELETTAQAALKVHIPDQLDDVEDNEEDQAWKDWGKVKKEKLQFNPPPEFDGKDLDKYQEEMLDRQMGTSMGFVKLRLGVSRKPEEAGLIARKWTDLLKTGSIQAKIYAVDRSTIMFVIERGQETKEVRDFVLSQDEAYEFKIGNAAFRRPGDPPLEVVLDQLIEEREAKEKAEKDAKKEAKKTAALPDKEEL